MGRAECVGQVFIRPGGHGPARDLAGGRVCSYPALGCLLLGWSTCRLLCGLGHGTGLLGLSRRAGVHGNGSSCGQGAGSRVQAHGLGRAQFTDGSVYARGIELRRRRDALLTQPSFIDDRLLLDSQLPHEFIAHLRQARRRFASGWVLAVLLEQIRAERLVQRIRRGFSLFGGQGFILSACQCISVLLLVFGPHHLVDGRSVGCNVWQSCWLGVRWQLVCSSGSLAYLGLRCATVPTSQQRRAGASNAPQGCAHASSSSHALGWINGRIEWHGRPLTLVLRDAFLNSLLSRLARPRLRRACNSAAREPLATGQETLRAKRAADPAHNGRDDTGAAPRRDSLILRGASILGEVIGCARSIPARHRRASRNTASLSRALDTLRSKAGRAPKSTSTLHRRARPNERASCLGCCEHRIADDVPAHRTKLIRHALGAIHLLLKALLFGLNDGALLGFAGLDDVLVDPAGDRVSRFDEVGSGRDAAGRRVGDFDDGVVYCFEAASRWRFLMEAGKRVWAPVSVCLGMKLCEWVLCHPPTLKERCDGGRTLAGGVKKPRRAGLVDEAGAPGYSRPNSASVSCSVLISRSTSSGGISTQVVAISSPEAVLAVCLRPMSVFPLKTRVRTSVN
ncbi:hypothetical protein A4F85_01955 [Delftia sp. GW456-R20]|nr:hypothetical protein A4F85_01955 [Delftia sp. GW456-R20]